MKDFRDGCKNVRDAFIGIPVPFLNFSVPILGLFYSKIMDLFRPRYDIIAINFVHLLINIWCRVLLSAPKCIINLIVPILGTHNKDNFILKIFLNYKNNMAETPTKHIKFKYPHKIVTVLPQLKKKTM